MKHNSAIIIPIRMHSSRLPGKFHKDIAGKPMIIRVLEKAIMTGIAHIYVAVDDEEHFKLIKDYGAHPIMTSTSHQSGTDRVYEALKHIDPLMKIKYVVNLQGDIPFVNPSSIIETMALLLDDKVDIATLATKITDPEEIYDPNVVKIAMNKNNQALYFSRAPIPFNSPHYYHHLGLYAFRREALQRFISLPQSPLELSEKLEQLRALENGMSIFIKETNEVPLSVDTEADLIKAIAYAKSHSPNI